MHKSKKAIGALRAYLGKDEEGLKLLDNITREVTELRKGVSTADDIAEAARKAASSRRIDLQRAEDWIVELKRSLDREQALLRQRDTAIRAKQQTIEEQQKRIDQLLPDLPPLEAECVPLCEDRAIPAKMTDMRVLVNTFNALRKEIPRCPEAVNDEVCNVYSLFDIIQSYSVAEMIRLGRFVTCMAMYQFPAAVAAPIGLTAVGAHNDVDDAAVDALVTNFASQMKPFFSWFRENYELEEFRKKLLKTRLKSDGSVPYYAKEW